MRCIPILLNNSNWKVRKGNVRLWYDNFLSSGPLFAEFPEGEHSQIKLKDLVTDNVWDVEELQKLLGLEILETRKMFYYGFLRRMVALTLNLLGMWSDLSSLSLSGLNGFGTSVYRRRLLFVCGRLRSIV